MTNDQQRNLLLPELPSDAILEVLEDMRRVEKDPRYEINMETWHCPIKNVCQVCMAGAYMARVIDNVDERADPAHVEELAGYPLYMGYLERIYSFDYLRRGMYGDFLGCWYPLEYLETIIYKIKAQVTHCNYEDNPEQFYDNMRQVSAILKEEGY